MIQTWPRAPLALGIGANATIFTWIKVIVLERLRGVDRPEALVEIWGATENNRALSLSYLDYVDLRDGNEVLSGLVAHQVQPVNLGRGGTPERVRGAIVSGNYFDVLGVKALIGRTFLPDEDRTPNARPVVVMGHGLWQRRFGGDPDIVGRAITLNAREFTVIGITPREFESTYPGIVLDVWTPVMMKGDIARPHFSLTDRGSRWLMVMGRLGPGVTVDQARANLASIARQLEQAYPETNEQMGVDVFLLTRSPFSLKRSLRSALAVLMTAVAVVLLTRPSVHATFMRCESRWLAAETGTASPSRRVALLYGVSPADPVTFAIIPTVLLGVTLAAGYLPARRAIRIDPTLALRIE